MLRPVLTSVIVHIVVVLVFTMSWSFFEDDRLVAQPLIIVDVVATVPKTNLAPSAKQKSEDVQKASASRAAPKPPPAPPVRPKPPAPKPPAPKPVPKPAPKPAPKPDLSETVEILPDKKSAVDVPLPKPKAKPVEKVDIALPVRRPKAPKKPAVPAEKPKPKPKPKPAAKPAPKPEPKPKPKPEVKPAPKPKADPDAAARLKDRVNKLAKKQKEKDRDQALTGVLQNLAKASATAKPDAPKKKNSEAQDNAEATLNAALEQAVQTNEPTQPKPIGMSEIDRLRAHITQFWSPPVGAANAHKLRVTVRIVRPQRDGTVDTVEVENGTRYRTDKVFRVAADAAKRAVLEASPLPLPADKYDQWKDYIIFEFDPSFISGE